MEKRDAPYAQFNFLVNLGAGGDPQAPDGGFQEISALGMEVGVAEYRYGNHPLNNTREGNRPGQVGRRHAQARRDGVLCQLSILAHARGPVGTRSTGRS